MLPSARQASACVLFICITALFASAQVTPAKTASVSGKVTLKNKPLAGVVVAAKPANYRGPDRSHYRGTTDQTGTYRITNLPPGTYNIAPLRAGLVSDDALLEKSLVIEEGDVVDNFNFSMARGGVITGKITDADGQPLVEQQVFVQPIEGLASRSVYYRGIVTDDRGIYRAFGLGEGKYRVSVGQSDNRLPGGSRLYPETFYPSVTDNSKATLVDVTEGSESKDIDIVVGRPIAAFKVTGRIVDAETGKPMPYIPYGIYRSMGEYGGESTSGSKSGVNGEFRFDGVIPGKYSVFVMPEQGMDLRSDWVAFEVVDRDVSDLVVKTIKASSISGVVVFDGIEDPSAIAKLRNLYVHAMLDTREAQFQGTPAVTVGTDGSFRLSGLWPGTANFGVITRNNSGVSQLSIVRVERDGIVQPNGLLIKDGEQITGVRLVVRYMTGVLRGQVKIEDGEVADFTRFQVWLTRVDENRSLSIVNRNSSPRIDERGRFVFEGLAAGTYEININIVLYEANSAAISPVVKQQVTVTDNGVTEVTVPVKLKP